ncbi:MAG: BatA domain-containing protein [Victivallales bacterium]|nr:BatA domain-containing protein [Victivallales bacterium]
MPVFTAGIFLLSALAVVVPLALHLLHKRQPQPIKFAAVRFMRDAIAKSRRSRRLTQGLTLLMRCLILLLLAFAFSQPFLRQSNYLPEGRRKLFIVLDGSASMQAREGESSMFEKGQAWINSLIDTLNDGDMVALLVPGENGIVSVVPPIMDHGHIRELLGDAHCSNGAVDIAESIRDALRMDGELLTDFELHVFSDFQSGSWRQESIANLSAELTRRHCAVFLNCPHNSGLSDAGVMTLSFSPSSIIGDGPYSCTYQLYHSEAYAGSLTVRLLGDGREQDQLTTVLPGAELSDRLTGVSEGQGSHSELVGEVSIDEDSYRLNDKWYFSLPRLDGQPAMIVNGSGDERDSFFLTRALKPRGMAFSHVSPETKDWAGLLNSSDLAGYSIIFVCNPPTLDSTVIDRLGGYVEEGGLLVLFPGTLNGLTEQSVQKLCGTADIRIPQEILPEETGFQMTTDMNANLHDRFLKRISEMVSPPWQITARKRLPLQFKGTEARRFISYVNGDKYDGNEFMLRFGRGNGQVFICSVSANRDWSDLPLTPFYFVLVQELSRYGAGYRHRSLQATVGEDIALPLMGTAKEFGAIVASDMTGKKCELSGSIDSSGKMLILNGFHNLGIYTVDLPWGEKRQIAVNLPEAEKMLSFLSSTELLDGRLGDLPVAYSVNQEELRKQMNLAGHRFPLSPWLLIAAFCLSMVEVIYANIRSLRPPQPKTVETLLKHGGGVA